MDTLRNKLHSRFFCLFKFCITLHLSYCLIMRNAVSRVLIWQALQYNLLVRFFCLFKFCITLHLSYCLIMRNAVSRVLIWQALQYNLLVRIFCLFKFCTNLDLHTCINHCLIMRSAVPEHSLLFMGFETNILVSFASSNFALT